MKKICSLILVLVMLLTGLVFAGDRQFVQGDEVSKASEWAEDSLLRLRNFNMYKSGWNYQAEASRGTVVHSAVKLHEMLIGRRIVIEDFSSRFEDAPYSYAIKALKTGISNGTGDGKFNVTDSVTREEAVCTLVKAIENSGYKLREPDNYKFDDDNLFNGLSSEYIYKAKANGIIDIGDNNKFYPKKYVSIEEYLVMLDKSLILTKVEPLVIFKPKAKHVYKDGKMSEIWQNREALTKETLASGNSPNNVKFTASYSRYDDYNMVDVDRFRIKRNVDNSIANDIEFYEDSNVLSIEVFLSLDDKNIIREVMKDLFGDAVGDEIADNTLERGVFSSNENSKPYKKYTSVSNPNIEFFSTSDNWTGDGHVRYINIVFRDEKIIVKRSDKDYWDHPMLDQEVEKIISEKAFVNNEAAVSSKGLIVGVQNGINSDIAPLKVYVRKSDEYVEVVFNVTGWSQPGVQETMGALLTYWSESDYIWTQFNNAIDKDDSTEAEKGIDEWEVNDKGIQFMMTGEGRGVTVFLRMVE